MKKQVILIWLTTLVGSLVYATGIPAVTNSTCFPNKTISVKFADSIEGHKFNCTQNQTARTIGKLAALSCAVKEYDKTSIQIGTVELDKYVYIIFDSKTSKNGTIGGNTSKEISVRCNEINSDGINRTPSLRVADFMMSSTLAPVTPSFQLALKINKGSWNSGTKPSTPVVDLFVIGQEYTLWITGPEEYHLYPQSCTAADKNTDDKEVYHLLTDECTKDVSLLGDFKAVGGNVYAPLYGFRFVSSDEVYLTCTIRVCPTEECGSVHESLKTHDTDPCTTRRRRSIKREMSVASRLRRDSNELTSVLHEVKMKLHVVDKPNEISGSPKLYDIQPLMMLLVSVLYTIARRLF